MNEEEEKKSQKIGSDLSPHELLVKLSPPACLIFGVKSCANEESIDVRVEIFR